MRRKAVTRPQRSRSSGTAEPDGSIMSSVAVAAMVIATASALLLVDTRSEATFDAPKRFAAMIGVAVAAACALWRGATSPPGSGLRSTPHRLILVFAAAMMMLALLSACWSPRRAIAIDSSRALLLFATVPVIAAGPALSSKVWNAVVLTFTAASALNAIVSLAQTADLYQPFRYATVGGRANTSAFVGNDGQLGLTMAFAALIALQRVFSERGPRRRAIYGALLALLLTGLITNRGLTPVASFAVGAAIIALIRITNVRRILVTLAVAAIITAVALTAYPPMRGRVLDVWRSAADRDWSRITSYRFGPWAAASEMWMSRPLLGWGPGTFASEFAPNLIRAEIRWRARLVNPFLVGSYSEAHSDYIQALAELGAPAVLFALLSAGMTIYFSIRALSTPLRTELALPVAIAMAGAVAALTWFPLHQPATAILLLAALGRSWRLSFDSRRIER